MMRYRTALWTLLLAGTALQAQTFDIASPDGRQAARAPRSEKDILIQQYNALQQDIDTYENNIGFFAMSKNSEPLIKQMQQKIEDAKQELKALEEKIRTVESEENNG